MTLIDSVPFRSCIDGRRIGGIDGHGDNAAMTHPLRKVGPGLPSVTSLINVIIGRDIDDIRILGMELDEDDRVTTIAAHKRDCKKEEREQNFHEVDAVTAFFTDSS